MTTHEILQKLEWQETELGPRCPLCRAYQPRGHREGCEMQEAIFREVPGDRTDTLAVTERPAL